MALYSLKNWSPFHIDALGMVTLLGADELNLTVGRLARNRYTENLPVLGAYNVANNAICKPLLGFTIYNITDGILATDVTPWFARWLICANLTYSSSTLLISVTEKPRFRTPLAQIAPLSLGVTVSAPMVMFAVLTRDWWGFANSISMVISVVVRRVVTSQLCRAIDRQLQSVFADPSESVKCFCTFPDGTAVTMVTQRRILVDCLLTRPRPPDPRLYEICRAWGWAAFGCHVVALGMACLFNQVLSVVVLLVATVVVARGIGDDDMRVGTRLELRRLDSTVPGFRSAAYARMGLTAVEEASMRAWNLFPHESNEFWWKRYKQYSGTV